MKKIWAFLLVMLLIAVSAGCTGKDDASSGVASYSVSLPQGSGAGAEASGSAISKEEIKNWLDDNLPKAKEITGIFWGNGLEYDQAAAGEPPADGGQWFVPVTSDTYQSIQEIKTAVETVFTSQFAQDHFYKDGFEGQYKRYIEEDNILKIDLNQMGTNSGFDWQTATIEVVQQSDTKVVVQMENMDNYQTKGEGQLTLEKTDSGWRLASAV